MTIEEIKEGVKEAGLYDFIGVNYYRMTREELSNIIKEIDYAIYDQLPGSTYEGIIDTALLSLDERWL